ncbi:MAG: MFS transporter [Deltaproteobacteria bacterium]|nr:MFS transporter [Deltaproteobacteria bacterium]
MVEPPDAPPHWRRRIFALTWLSYFSYYFTRNAFKASKAAFQRDYHLSKSQLNWIDTTYNIAYCVGQVTNGALVERIGPRRWLAIGMLLSAAMCVAFQQVGTPSGELMGIYMVIWGINGFAQSSGWPANGKAMAEWYGSERRGTAMGLWSTCYQAGGLVATFLSARVIGWGFGWRSVFIAPAIWVAVVAVAIALWLRDRPSQVGYRDPDAGPLSDLERRRLRAAEMPRVLRTPMVWMLGAAYFCCKSIRYSFIFWLPLYLAEAYHYSDSTSLDVSMAFDAGGIVFVVAAGVIADRVFARRRVLTAFGFLWALVGALFLYRQIAEISPTVNVLGLALVGGCLFAADSLISGAVTQDLGGPHAAGLAAGLVNGIGSIGQVVQGFVLVWVSETYGWGTLFAVFMALAAAGALCLIPYLRVMPGHRPAAGAPATA